MPKYEFDMNFFNNNSWYLSKYSINISLAQKKETFYKYLNYSATMMVLLGFILTESIIKGLLQWHLSGLLSFS